MSKTTKILITKRSCKPNQSNIPVRILLFIVFYINILFFTNGFGKRTIQGQYQLTIGDLEQMTCFEDRVACGCYPMDIHDPITNTVVWKILPGVYHIPYRSLLPKGLHRTLAAGKCLCADQKAFGAVRVMPIMMNVGESAGYAVALAAREDKCLDELDAPSLRACLTEKYGA